MKKYHKHIVLNQSVFMDENTNTLMELLDKGYEILNIHNNVDGKQTIYILQVPTPQKEEKV